MRTFNQYSCRRSLLAVVAGVCVVLSISGCIRNKPAVSSGGGGGTTPVGTTCSNLQGLPVTYKGGDGLGEELTFSVDGTTLAYSITVDTGDLRTAGTQVTGTLTQLADCHFSSDEDGAVFTFGANGLVQGGIRPVTGTAFAPLLAFTTTYNNASAPTTFTPIVATFNTIGEQTTTGVSSSYFGSGRIRTAGTMQFCAAKFDANSCSTEKGYFTYNSTHNAFDYFALSASASFPSPPTGGTLAGSMIVGMVDTAYVGLFLRRASATDYGMRLLTPQASLVKGGDGNYLADGGYQVVDSNGSNAAATWAETSFTRASDVTALTYDSPIAGVVAVAPTGTSVLTGHLIYAGEVFGFAPSSAGSALFEMGLQESP